MSETVIVQTNSGPVRGRLEHNGPKHSDYYSFRGIPYAKPPVGELRFKAPQRPEPWTDVLDCTGMAPIPIQIKVQFYFDTPPLPNRESEDCLYVNVYKKFDAASNAHDGVSKKLPVVVMIHGGAFAVTFGGDQFQPDYLLEGDVLYITLNYRLGVFGFLSIADPSFDVPGNAGLKDQAAALRWVRENCAYFGGDAGNITVMGFSAGAVSVHYHLISDHSKGLFDRAIVQSGSALAAWACEPPHRDVYERLARGLGWTGCGGDASMFRTIIDATTEDIAEQQNQLAPSTEEVQRCQVVLFSPSLEPYDNGTIFIDRPVAEMNASAWGDRIPLLVGGVSGEAYVVYCDVMKERHDSIFEVGLENALPHDLRLAADENGDAKRRHLSDALWRFYYADETPTRSNIHLYMDLLTDKLIWHPMWRIVQARLNNPAGSAPTYLYHFDYSSELLNTFQMVMCAKHIPDRMVHSDDSLYLYRMPQLHDALPDDCWEVRLRKINSSLVTTFADSGKPRHADTEALNWQPVCSSGPESFKCLNISNDLSVIDLPNLKRMLFWDSLYTDAKE